MPPIIVLALGALAAGAIVHRVVKEARHINAELDRVKTRRAIDPVSREVPRTLRRDPRSGYPTTAARGLQPSIPASPTTWCGVRSNSVFALRLPPNMGARQSSKIRELGDALIAEGYLTLDEQARALGLGRNTTWTILKRHYKTSGLSAGIINRMLAAPRLPALVRAGILEYIDEKTAGLYGHSNTQLRRFAIRLTVKPADRTRPSGTKVDREIVN
jgi:hypothetical protein